MSDDRDDNVIVELFENEPRLGEIFYRLLGKIYDECEGLPLVTALGLLTLAKSQLERDANDR